MSENWFLRRFRSARTGVLSRFLKDPDGSVTIEYVLWAPLILTTFIFISDVAFALTVNATMWHGSRDTARALSTHQITKDEAIDYLRDRLMSSGRDYSFDVVVEDSSVVVSVSIPYSDSGVTKTISRYIDGHMVARVMMYREPA